MMLDDDAFYALRLRLMMPFTLTPMMMHDADDAMLYLR
jgi:hypothetical protein